MAAISSSRSTRGCCRRVATAASASSHEAGLLLAVSVDLDELRLYRSLYGLPEQATPSLVYERAVARLSHWAQERALPITWFVVGQGAEHAGNAEVLRRLAVRGRPSSAIVDVPEVLRAPTVPYRVGRPYWFRGTGIWEIPVQVTRGAQLPFIGTALAMAGTTGARLLARSVVGLPFVNLELH